MSTVEEKCPCCDRILADIAREMGVVPAADLPIRWNISGDHVFSAIASPTMEMRVEELEAWLRHHGLGLSVTFNDRCYSAELRIKIGDTSIVAMEAKAAEFGVAVISACQNYEREHVQHIT